MAIHGPMKVRGLGEKKATVKDLERVHAEERIQKTVDNTQQWDNWSEGEYTEHFNDEQNDTEKKNRRRGNGYEWFKRLLGNETNNSTIMPRSVLCVRRFLNNHFYRPRPISSHSIQGFWLVQRHFCQPIAIDPVSTKLTG